MPMPQAGDAAPDFQLQDQDGNTVTLSRFAGKNVVLYFYPKDDTPGCTVEACSFRDEHSTLEAAGAVVLGVSADSTASHRKFATKFSLPFPLLADTEHQMSEAYGVWGEKSLYGRKFLGITRATFLIGPDGKVKQVWPKVKVTGHVVEVLAALGAKPASLPSGELPAPGSGPEDSSTGEEEGTREAPVESAPMAPAPARVPVTKFEAPKRKAARPGDAGTSAGPVEETTPASAKQGAPKAPATKAPVKKAASATKGAAKTAAAKGAAKTAGAKGAATKDASKAAAQGAAKKGASKTAAAKGAAKAAGVKGAAKKGAAAKGAATKGAAAKGAATKGAATKGAAAKGAATKGAAKKAAAAKGAAKKAAPAKKGAAKKGGAAKKAASKKGAAKK